jgi:hypothetical protein
MQSDPKNKRLLIVFYLVGAMSLVLFTITKSAYLMDKLTISGTPYGNLYKNCRVDVFKIPKEPTKPPPDTYNRTPIDDCDIIVIGDSFVSSCPGHYYYGVELSQRMNVPVFQLEIKPDLFYELNRSGISYVEKERLFLFESGESGIIKNFSALPDLRPVRIEPADDETLPFKEDSFFLKIRKRWFVGTEKNYSYFIKNNIIIESLVDRYYSFLFHRFGIISDLTPVYSLDPPMLFESRVLGRQITSYYYPHTDRLIRRLADNIKTVSDSLKVLYNVRFIFMGIPDKYTLYHTFVNDDPYDNYLPRLNRALKDRGIPVVDLYEPFKTQHSTKILYHPSDNHWVSEGVEIALQETVPVLNELLRERDEQTLSGINGFTKNP